MNPLKKAYCRAYQTVFKLALPLLPYRKPKRLESVNELPALFIKKNIDSVMLVTDASIRSNNITSNLENLLIKTGITCIVYDKTVANPTTDNVEEARQLYLDNGCKALIGFGGGSSIDCAKAVGARIVKPNQPLSKMKGILKVRKKLPLLVAIPTTAGTGSETTLAAVIVDSETRHKYPINDFPLIPHYAVLDPEVTKTLPPSLTATTGMDALTHAVEAYIGRSTTHGTRKDSIRAVQLIFKYLERAYKDGNDITARKKMLYAAYLAGSAFTKSYVGYVHAVAHSLGGRYNTPHGLANAVLLPHVLKAYGPAVHKKLANLAICIGIADENTPEEDASNAFIEAICNMQKALNIPEYIDGIVEDDIPKLARYAEKEANPLYPVPVLMTARELRQFYIDVMKPEN
ncbi:MAG: iron-containing alcohol dehydrogenase [Butyrivibrio sp.]